MLLEIVRLPAQIRALHCYVMLSIWILLLVAGVYKFLEPKVIHTAEFVSNSELITMYNLDADLKTRRIFRTCNVPEDIVRGVEASIDSNQWDLQGILLLVRHGDRGPLQHVKNITSINCGTPQTKILAGYQAYLQNVTATARSSWVGPGAFHGFPLLPNSPKQCHLGQLTMQGVAQLLKVGQMLRESYARIFPRLANLTQADVAVYSTKYRRTFQSALSLLYSFISGDTLAKLSFIESPSMSFCFSDCGCPATDKYLRYVKSSLNQHVQSHPAVSQLAINTGKILFSTEIEQESVSGDPQSVRDALLAYICHGSVLPCDTASACIKRQNVAGIFAYTDWESHQKWGNMNWKRYCTLRSYGMVKHIVSRMLHMVAGTGPRIIYYSGHDHTIQYLSTTLGLKNEPLSVRYAARIVFEVYRRRKDKDQNQGVQGVYFRVLLNGKDVTSQVSFCKSLMVEEDSSFCRVEDIVRFLHDDYFVMFNATNFKDACTIKQAK